MVVTPLCFLLFYLIWNWDLRGGNDELFQTSVNFAKKKASAKELKIKRRIISRHGSDPKHTSNLNKVDIQKIGNQWGHLRLAVQRTCPFDTTVLERFCSDQCERITYAMLIAFLNATTKVWKLF